MEKGGNAKRKGADALGFPLSALIWIITGIVILIALTVNVKELGRATDMCERTQKTKIAEIKDVISEVCSNPVAGGVYREFTPAERGCEQETRFYAATCDEIGWLLSVTGPSGFGTTGLGVENLVVAHKLATNPLTDEIFWGAVDTVISEIPERGLAPYTTGGETRFSEESFSELIGSIYVSSEINYPESVFAETYLGIGRDFGKIPSQDLFSFVNGDMELILNSAKIAIVPAGVDRTILVAGVEYSDVDGAIAAANLNAKGLLREWKGVFAERVIDAYGSINSNVATETLVSRNRYRISDVLTEDDNGYLTVRPEIAQKLANLYAEFVRKEGGRLSGDYSRFNSLSPTNLWADFLAKVRNFNDPLYLREDGDPSKCKGIGNFCSMSLDFAEKLDLTRQDLSRLSERYKGIVAGRDAALNLVRTKVAGGSCETYSGPGYSIPKCALMVSCAHEDAMAFWDVQKDACIVSAINLQEPPKYFPTGSVPRRIAVDFWDMATTNRHAFTGSCSSGVPINCPASISDFSFGLVPETEERKRTVFACIRNMAPDCTLKGNCFCCETIACVNEVDFHTKSYGKSIVENVGTLSTGGGNDVITQINGTVYPFCYQEGARDWNDLGSCVWQATRSAERTVESAEETLDAYEEARAEQIRSGS